MISTLIIILLVGLLLYIIWLVCGMFTTGKPHQIIGTILALVFLLYALRALGVRLP